MYNKTRRHQSALAELGIDKLDYVVEEIWFSHSVVMRSVRQFLPRLPFRFANRIQFFHMRWPGQQVGLAVLAKSGWKDVRTIR